MKREIKNVSGVPNKRLFWSIMNDYSLPIALCELIDNALDIWTRNGRLGPLHVKLDLDSQRQLIKVEDDAGGVSEDRLPLLISPGASDNQPDDHIIGLFGVGSKRAVVALAEVTKIQTRYGGNRTFEVDITNEWLESESWDMPIYEIDPISENTTIIDMSVLRLPVSEEFELELSQHLSQTYSTFLKQGNFYLKLNGTMLNSVDFDIWAYPPGYEPRYYQFTLPTEDGPTIGVEITAGLVREKDPGKDDYGVYFYCNDRLISKEVKNRNVGYVTKLAGKPHSDASLARTIVRLYGPAKLMPWNSSKSQVHWDHAVFKGLQNFLIPVVSDYSSLSRRFKGHWDDKVFAFPSGEMEYIDINDVEKVKRTFLPPLPRIRKQAIDRLVGDNAAVLNEKPWLLGLMESLVAVEIISKSKLETRNRICLILLDSTFEISLKEYIVHEENLNLKGKTLSEIFEQRDSVISVVRQKIFIAPEDIRKIKHYYSLRNKLIHEKATVDVTGSDIAKYSVTITHVLHSMFGVVA